MDKYNERVKALAEEMAEKPHYWNSYGLPFTPEERQKIISRDTSKMMPAARIAIKHMAEAIIVYAYGSIEHYNSVREGKEEFDKELQEMGLIPSPAEQSAQNNVE